MARRRMVGSAASARARVGVVLRATLVTLIVGTVALLSVGPALAHSELVSSDPVDGGDVIGVDRPVTLVFGETLDVGSINIRLIGSSGYQAQLVPPTVTSTQVVQPLPTLLNDQYVLRYDAVASDGHPVRGAITFTVSGSVAGAVAGPDRMQHAGPHADVPTAGASGSDERWSVPAWVWLGGVVAVLAAAIVTVRRLRTSGG